MPTESRQEKKQTTERNENINEDNRRKKGILKEVKLETC